MIDWNGAEPFVALEDGRLGGLYEPQQVLLSLCV